MAESTAVVPVAFHRPKAGSAQQEWEDCAGYDPGDSHGPARFVVVDGATEAFDAVRWVRQLVRSFLGKDDEVRPALAAAELDEWFGRMQVRWVEDAPRAFANVFEERKFQQDGSFATFLGCEVSGLDGPKPYWSAAALGDAVLFHVRDGRVINQLPRLAPQDFDLNPDGVFTQPSMRARMRAGLLFDEAAIEVGDWLFLATDAMAHWMASMEEAGGTFWQPLAEFQHPADFARFVARERTARRMKNDDVTLLRVQIAPVDADVLVICR